jgi:RHS repeat-associated protein
VEPEEGPRWRLSRQGQGFRLEDPAGGPTLHFAPVAGTDAGVLPLAAIEDRNRNRIDVCYDARGLLTGLRHTGGYAVAVDSDGGLVTGLRLLGADRTGDRTLIRYDYDSAGRLTGVVNSSGRPLRFDYDAAGRVVAWHDRNGTSYRYTYDARGRCVATAGSAGCLDGTLSYDDERRTTTVTDSLGCTVSYELNEDRQVVRQTDALGSATTSEWDRYDRLLASTDALGLVTRYDYDGAGNLIRVLRPDGSTATAAYHRPGLPELVTGPDGAIWRREYDGRGNLTSLTDPTGAVTRYGYDARGAVATVVEATGGRTRIENDAAGLPVAVTDASGGTVRCARDMSGRVTAVTDATGATTSYEWTVEGRPASRTVHSGLTERWSYDAEGNPVEHTDPDGRVTSIAYTHFDLPAARTGPDGARLVFSYDSELRLVAVTDPAGLVWHYRYDAAGRLVGEVDFAGRELSYRLDPVGRLVEAVNGAGETVTYARDALGRMVRRVAGDAVTGFEYDPAGRVSRVVNPAADVRLDYDPVGRVLAETCNGRRLTSSYDRAGRRVSRTTPSGARSTWEYGVTGLPAALGAGASRVELGHDAAGREVERRLGGVRLGQSWDGDSRLHSQQLTTSAGQLVERRYSYRGDGYVTAIQDSRDGLRSVELDPVGRITGVSAAGRTERYAYGPAGAPVSASWPGAAAAGEREYVAGQVRRAGATSFGYDRQGRMTWRRTRTLSGQCRAWSYEWDAEDRLVGVHTPAGDRWRYDYDGLGRRIAKRRLLDDGTPAERVDYSWDGARLAEQIRTGPAGIRVTTWDWEPGTFRPVGQTDRTGLPEPDAVGDAPQEWVDEQFHAIVADLVGTPTELVDADGRLAWRSRTSVWGAPAGERPSDVSPAVDCPLRFPGQYADQETGLRYNLFRYYDPQTARYLSPDPIGLAGGADPHAYVPNPLHWADPLGLAPYPVGDDDLVRVGRWMSGVEHQAMVDTGLVQEGAGGTSYVAHPADATAYMSQAKPGTRYVEFDVPRSSLAPASKEGWAQIPGPNSLLGRLAARRGDPPPQFPPALNIEWIASKL